MTILGRSEELVSRCVECDLAEPESLASLGGSAPGVVDGILSHHDKYVQTKNGRHHLRKAMKGWELLIKWKDKSESWIKLADMKESHPVEVAEYARARGIDKEPAFEWWVPHTLKKRQVILSALKKRIRKTTH